MRVLSQLLLHHFLIKQRQHFPHTTSAAHSVWSLHTLSQPGNALIPILLPLKAHWPQNHHTSQHCFDMHPITIHHSHCSKACNVLHPPLTQRRTFHVQPHRQHIRKKNLKLSFAINDQTWNACRTTAPPIRSPIQPNRRTATSGPVTPPASSPRSRDGLDSTPQRRRAKSCREGGRDSRLRGCQAHWSV